MQKKAWQLVMLLAVDFALLILISSVTAQALHLGQRGERVLAVQEQLAESGFFSGNKNGILDFGTRKAIKKFQKANGLEASGKTDFATLDAMGISSRTAECFTPEAEILARCIQASGCRNFPEMLAKGIEILESTKGISTLCGYAYDNLPEIDFSREPICDAYSAAVQSIGIFSEQTDSFF